ncbi:MAG TPA: hypothetical protein VFJ58_08910 [Armatimonadota bacterium]|nr:hypothetical protein [Armatimonadota bacterium]
MRSSIQPLPKDEVTKAVERRGPARDLGAAVHSLAPAGQERTLQRDI